MISRLLPCLLGAALCGCEDAVALPPLESAPGRVSVLDTAGPNGDTGWWPSVRFDGRDQPHIVYCDATNGDVRYATREGQSWRTRAVVSEGAVGKYVALALDAHGQPGITYYDQDQKLLRYAEPRGDGPWVSETIAWGLEIGVGAELRFDAERVAHVFYYAPSGKFIHGVRRPAATGGWERQPIAEASGGFSARTSVVARPEGFWASFLAWNLRETALLLAWPKRDGWDVHSLPLEPGAGWRSFLVFDTPAPSVLYTVAAKRKLMLASLAASGKWSSTRVLDDVGNFAAAQAPGGALVVAYEDIHLGEDGMGTLKLLERTADGWRRFGIDSEGPVANYVSVALDSKARPLVAYHSRHIRGLKLYDETGGP